MPRDHQPLMAHCGRCPLIYDEGRYWVDERPTCPVHGEAAPPVPRVIPGTRRTA